MRVEPARATAVERHGTADVDDLQRVAAVLPRVDDVLAAEVADGVHDRAVAVVVAEPEDVAELVGGDGDELEAARSPAAAGPCRGSPAAAGRAVRTPRRRSRRAPHRAAPPAGRWPPAAPRGARARRWCSTRGPPAAPASAARAMPRGRSRRRRARGARPPSPRRCRPARRRARPAAALHVSRPTIATSLATPSSRRRAPPLHHATRRSASVPGHGMAVSRRRRSRAAVV